MASTHKHCVRLPSAELDAAVHGLTGQPGPSSHGPPQQHALAGSSSGRHARGISSRQVGHADDWTVCWQLHCTCGTAAAMLHTAQHGAWRRPSNSCFQWASWQAVRSEAKYGVSLDMPTAAVLCNAVAASSAAGCPRYLCGG